MIEWSRHIRLYKINLTLACVSLILLACDNPKPQLDLEDRVDESTTTITKADRSNEIPFGFDLRASPQEDAKQYLPFLKYLETTTKLRFKLRFTPSGNSIVDDLGNNVVQFAAIGADTFIAAEKKYGVLPVVRGLNKHGRSEYQSIFVVLPDSPINKLSDIRGKRLALGSNHSTQGNLIPRIVLMENSIGLDQLSSYEHTGSHQNCANAVISGKADVCGMQDTMARSLVKDGHLRILYTSDFYPSSGIAANKNVSTDIIAKVKQAMLDFKPQGKHKTGLYHWERTEMPLGFENARVEDYDQLKHWSQRLANAEVHDESKDK